MNLNAFIPPILMQNHEEQRHTVTRKRMERFTSGGQLLSVTNVKTTHFDDNPMPFSSNSVSSSSYIPTPTRVFNNRNANSDSDYGYTTIHTYRSIGDRRNDESHRTSRPAPVEREYPIKRIDRVVPHEIIREYQNEPIRETRMSNKPEYQNFEQTRNHQPLRQNQNQDWKTTDSYVRKTSILKTGKSREPQYPTGTLGSSQRVEWREPLDCLIDRMNRIRSSIACLLLQPSVRLADIAAQWARMLALRGEFKTDPGADMNIWMGTRVTESIADIWWDESEEFGTKNFMDDPNLSWVGVASAFSEHHRQFLVVAVYE